MNWNIIKRFSSRNMSGVTFQDAERAFSNKNRAFPNKNRAFPNKNRACPGKNRTDHDKLFYYFARNMNKSAKKRFLFLTDLLGLGWSTEQELMMEELGTGISL